MPQRRSEPVAEPEYNHITLAKRGMDPCLGELILLPFGYCPEGTVLADGTLLSITQYTALCRCCHPAIASSAASLLILS